MSPNSDFHDPFRKAESEGKPKTVDLEFETLEEFREIMAPRFNYDGFFVATTDPLPRGTEARFRFLLPDGYVLAEGTGVVAWSRYEDEEPDLRAGMALLFDALDQQNREVVDELVEFHRGTGGEPFDLGPRASEAGDIGTDALSGEVFDVPPPPESAIPNQAEPELELADDSSEQSENYLPNWLSEVAQKHDVEFLADDSAPADDAPETVEPPGTTEAPGTFESPESPELPETPEPGGDTRPAMPELEASLFYEEEPDASQLRDDEPDIGLPEEEASEATPLPEDIAPAAEVTLPHRDAVEKPRDLRLRYILPVIAILVAASAVVFWIVNRTIPLDVSEPTTTIEGPRLSEAPIAVDEEPTSEPDIESVESPTGKPVEIAETAADEPGASGGEPVAPRVPETTVPATRVLLVAATRVGEETVVTVRANGELTESTVRVAPLKDPARVWVRIKGIETFYRPNNVEVGTPEVERVRVGHHPEETPQSIYVVVDLTSPTATIHDQTIEGDTLRIVIAR